jgi:hypothetical protein
MSIRRLLLGPGILEVQASLGLYGFGLYVLCMEEIPTIERRGIRYRDKCLDDCRFGIKEF